jgi:hypothetical protein
LFGRSERLERRADDLNGGPVLINRTPGGYEAGIALKAGIAPALIADYERKAVAGRIPCSDLLDGSNHATELHDATRITAPRHQVMELRRMCDGVTDQLRRTRRVGDTPGAFLRWCQIGRLCATFSRLRAGFNAAGV